MVLPLIPIAIIGAIIFIIIILNAFKLAGTKMTKKDYQPMTTQDATKGLPV